MDSRGRSPNVSDVAGETSPDRRRSSARRRYVRFASAAAGAALILSPLGAVIGTGTAGASKASVAAHTAHATLPKVNTVDQRAVPSLVPALQSGITSFLKSRTGSKGSLLTGPKPSVSNVSATHIYTVNTTKDQPQTTANLIGACGASKCTLRAAIAAASAATAPAEVVIPKGFYLLSYGPLYLTNTHGVVVEAAAGVPATTVVIAAANFDTGDNAGLPGSVSEPVVTLTTPLALIFHEAA